MNQFVKIVCFVTTFFAISRVLLRIMFESLFHSYVVLFIQIKIPNVSETIMVENFKSILRKKYKK